nr:hypothetical protein Iba_chr07bCG10160 [Ipomoea batatas]
MPPISISWVGNKVSVGWAKASIVCCLEGHGESAQNQLQAPQLILLGLQSCWNPNAKSPEGDETHGLVVAVVALRVVPTPIVALLF